MKKTQGSKNVSDEASGYEKQGLKAEIEGWEF